MKSRSVKLLLVFVAISMIISPNYGYIMTAKGQFAFPPNAPIEVWIDISPNPAYLGEDIEISIVVLSEELFGEQVEYSARMAALTSFATGLKVMLLEPGWEDSIPAGRMYSTSTDELLNTLASGHSSECIIHVTTNIEGYCGKVWQESFHIHNCSRPPDKPYLVLKKSGEKGEGLIERVVKIEVENIGSGNAKNVEITDSLPTSFAIVSGTIAQKYDSIRPSERKTFKYTIKPIEKGTFILDSATATYENGNGNSYSSMSNPVAMKTGPLAITIKHQGGEQKFPLEDFKPIPTPTQPAPTAPATSVPTPALTQISEEQTPTHLPILPPDDKEKGIWRLIYQLLPFFATIVLVVVLFKPVMLKYYERKVKKYEKKGYDVSNLKEVLKK